MLIHSVLVSKINSLYSMAHWAVYVVNTSVVSIANYLHVLMATYIVHTRWHLRAYKFQVAVPTSDPLD